MKHYTVTCLACEGSNRVKITEVRPQEFLINLNDDHRRDPNNIMIISGRYRTDLEFGWECICGNTSIIARDEFSQIDKFIIGGSADAIQRIAESLLTEDEKKFSFEED